MITYIIRRLLLMIPTLVGVTAVVFFVMAYAPGGFSAMLNEGGGQDMGVEARRIKMEYTNRYALDKPKVVQYFRWLNQVSPVGFQMSGDYKWSDEAQAQVAAKLETRDWAASERARKTSGDLILTAAIYSGSEPDEVLALFDKMAADPAGEGPALFELIDAQPITGDQFWLDIAAENQQSPEKAVASVLKELSFGSINKSRVMYGSLKLWDPDLGTDRNNRDVGGLIAERIQITLLMNLITIPIIYVVSIIAGVLAARNRGGWFDVGSGFVMLAMYSIPVIFAGTLLISYLANAKYLRWFPASGVHDMHADGMPFLPYWDSEGLHYGWLFDFAWHMVLPITCMTYAGFAFLTKVMRSSVLETISVDFVRTARAKGVSEEHILFRHVLRNSMLPLITMAAAILPGLFVGSFVIEYIFSIKGMGLLTVEAAKNTDVNVVMATTLVGAVLSLFSLLVRDILYAVADPRVSYE